MEHLGLAISLCFASLLVCRVSSWAKIKPRSRRGSVWPTLHWRKWVNPGAGNSASSRIKAEELPLLEWLLERTHRLAALRHTGRNPGRAYVCGTKECCRPHSEERRRVRFAANKIKALFQHSETYIHLYICHMAFLCSSTCVAAAQRWVKRAPKLRSIVGGEVALSGAGWVVLPEVGGDS